MATRAPLAVGKWYHCYNRGVDRRRVFTDAAEYERFLTLLYLCNGTRKIHPSDFLKRRFEDIALDTSLSRGEPLVSLGAWCLMPNHVHFLIKEVRAGGIALFMQKIFTGYTMYFNKKHARTGALFAGTFKSKHIEDDLYFKKAWAYVHLNPAELFEKKWKQGQGSVQAVEKNLRSYPHSSAADFEANRPQGKILDRSVVELFDALPNMREMLEDAQEYYASFRKVKP